MRSLSWLLAGMLWIGCGGASEEKTATTPKSEPAPAQQAMPAGPAAVTAVAPGTRDVRCGCSIESVGKCGNYVRIDDQFLEIANATELGLGEMEWCGQEGVHADTAGEIRDGMYHATTLAVHRH